MRNKTAQEQYWQGYHGTEWFTRNKISFEARVPLLRQIMKQTFGVRKICEYGCGGGHNLLALKELSNNYELSGIEIHDFAISRLKEFGCLNVITSSIEDVDASEKFDLVFGCGVLIHVSNELPIVYRKIDQLSNRYVLILEYFNPVPVDIGYQSQPGLLIKRDFAREFLNETGSKYRVVDYGFVWKYVDPAWDDINWTLLEK